MTLCSNEADIEEALKRGLVPIIYDPWCLFLRYSEDFYVFGKYVTLVIEAKSSPRIWVLEESAPRIYIREGTSPQIYTYGSSSPEVISFSSCTVLVKTFDKSTPSIYAPWGSCKTLVQTFDESLPDITIRRQALLDLEVSGTNQPKITLVGPRSSLDLLLED